MAAEKKAGRLSLGAGRLNARNFEFETGKSERIIVWTVKVGTMRGRSCFFLRLFILLHRSFSYTVLHCFTPFRILINCTSWSHNKPTEYNQGAPANSLASILCAPTLWGISKVTPTAPPKFLEAAFTEFPHGCDGQRQLKNIEIQKTRGWCLVLTKIGPKQCRDMSLSENRVSPILMLYHLFPIKHCNCARVPMFGHPNMSIHIFICIFMYIYIFVHTMVYCWLCSSIIMIFPLYPP